MPYWLQEFSTTPDQTLTASEDSLIVSILSVGTFFGALTAAPFGDLLGRRWGLMAAAGIVFNFGVILQTAAVRQPLFIAGRCFAGFGVGLISALSKFHSSPKCGRRPYMMSSNTAESLQIFYSTGFMSVERS